jgi:hypothetical protein
VPSWVVAMTPFSVDGMTAPTSQAESCGTVGNRRKINAPGYAGLGFPDPRTSKRQQGRLTGSVSHTYYVHVISPNAAPAEWAAEVPYALVMMPDSGRAARLAQA